jgi:uncharacterized membrane protein
MVVSVVSVVITPVLVAIEPAHAWGSKSFTCDGGYSAGSSNWTPSRYADTYSGSCPSVRVRQRNGNGTYGSWSYAGAGYIYIAVSASAIGGSHQAFNSYDTWVGVTT